MTTHSTHGSVTAEPLVRLTERGISISVRRIETPRGERLEFDVEDTDTAIRLDAIALECLTWQSEDSFLESVPVEARTAPSDDCVVERGQPAGSRTELTRITNEFCQIRVSRLVTDEREWLEIEAPKLGAAIALNAGAVRSVTHLDQRAFTALLSDRLNR
ncbi:hypothetical protein EA462_14955 [Natrarchaeobius halalkaliphilus]|uniref:Uncharacterized protein n=1 Tax=Natrarchaeobius halalkaliphilus TaxID=1679091 RepID=A0A3N6LI44_9EURY|nr:hypothetical protein [Natrarchaeobius halalkaliphilus]RQG86954.1 hypothetical protein EA462_14955 [Natrarchaeobius halalkaliphilus]